MDRALGQLERFDVVRQCNEGAGSLGKLSVSCTKCGCVHEEELHCQCSMLCTHARGKRLARLRGRAIKAFEHHISRLRPFIYSRALGPDKMGMKFVVFTMPHEGSVEHRWEVMHRAWRAFEKRYLRPWLRDWEARHGAELVWMATFEWTPGSDGFGHPHVNLMATMPYIDRDQLRRWWQWSLRSADCGRWEEAIHPRIRDALKGDRGVRSAVAELLKYITKDCGADRSDDEVGHLVHPMVFETICALREGKRSYRTSNYFFRCLNDTACCPKCASRKSRKRSESCPDCGTGEPKRAPPRQCGECHQLAHRDSEVSRRHLEGHRERVFELLERITVRGMCRVRPRSRDG